MGAYPSGHKDPRVAALIFILEKWLVGLEDGTVANWFPDMDYIRPDNKPLWTEEQLGTLVTDLDHEHDIEVERTPGTSTGSNAGPGFLRLTVPQRLALAQELETEIEKWRLLSLLEARERVLLSEKLATQTADAVYFD